MIIRKAKTSDIASLYALEKELFSVENYPLSKSSFAYHLRNNLFFVAEIEGKIAGYVLVLIKRKNAKLYSIGVSELYRGKKISQMLLKTISKELVDLGFSTLLLEVRIDNNAAISLYEKFGFSKVKILKSFYKDGCDAYLMELKYADKTL